MSPIGQDRYLRIWQVAQMAGLSRSTIYNYITIGGIHYLASFPKPRRIGKRSIAWLESEVVQWMISREVATAA